MFKRVRFLRYALLFGGLSVAVFGFATTRDTKQKPPVEVGTVSWGRSYDDALAQAKESGKPMLVLFQEVPG